MKFRYTAGDIREMLSDYPDEAPVRFLFGEDEVFLSEFKPNKEQSYEQN